MTVAIAAYTRFALGSLRADWALRTRLTLRTGLALGAGQTDRSLRTNLAL